MYCDADLTQVSVSQCFALSGLCRQNPRMVLNRPVFNNSTSARGCECSSGGAVSWQELASWYIVLVFLLHHQANLNEVILWWDGKVHKHIDAFIYAWLQKWHFDLADMSFWCFMGQSSFHISNILLKFVECSLTLPSILHCGILKSADRLWVRSSCRQ